MDTPQQLFPNPVNASTTAKQRSRLRRGLDWLAVAALTACALAIGVWYGWNHAGQASPPGPQAEAHWRDAQAAEGRRDYAKARSELTACLAAWPLNAETNYFMARVCRQQKDIAAWSDYLHRASQLQWPAEQVSLEEALEQAQVGNLAGVQSGLLAYMQRRPDEAPLVYEALAEGYLVNRRYRELWELAAAWSTRFPSDWLAWRYRADAFYLDGGAAKAIPDYRHALDQAPDPDLVRPFLAIACVDAGQHKDALPLYEAYLVAHPNNPTALYGVAVCQHALGNEPAARQALTKALHQQPNNPNALLLQGKLDLEDGHADQAAATLRRAEKLAPWRTEILHSLARALQDLHQNQAAAECQARLKRLADDLRQIDRLKKELHAKPRDVAVRFEIAELNRTMGDWDEAVRWYTGVLALDPTHAASRKALAEYVRHHAGKASRP